MQPVAASGTSSRSLGTLPSVCRAHGPWWKARFNSGVAAILPSALLSGLLDLPPVDISVGEAVPYQVVQVSTGTGTGTCTVVVAASLH